MPSDYDYQQEMRRRIEEARRPGPRRQAPASVRALRPSVYDRGPRRTDADKWIDLAQRSTLRHLAENGPTLGDALVKRLEREGRQREDISQALRLLLRQGLIETVGPEGKSGVSTIRWALTDNGEQVAARFTT